MQNDHIVTSANYVTPEKYISGRIVEYDIQSANINVLKKYHKISDNYYNYLSLLPKTDREVEIGKLIRVDRSYYDTIQKGIKESKLLLVEKNHIKPEQIIRVANDAVYINSSVDLRYTEFDGVKFKQKSKSSVYLNLSNIYIFYSVLDNDNIDIDVKNIGKDKLIYHEKFIEFLANAIYICERVSVQDCLNFISDFYKDYISLKLDKEYYREFNSYSLYKLKYSDYYLSNISNINDMDINFNLYLIRELWSIILSKYKFKR